MARRKSAQGMRKTVRLLATGLAALILCGGLVLLFVQKERAAANAAGEPTAEPIEPTPARFTVVIDPGHGQPDGGATGVDTGIAEEGINLNYALALKAELSALNIAAVLTREDENALDADKKKDMAVRRDIINSAGADAVISIHMNKFGDRSVSGPMAFYMKGSAEGEKLAKCVLDGVCGAIGRPLRHVNPGDYYIIKNSEPPSVILECGFLSNTNDEALLQTEEHMRAMMKGAADGILSYLENNEAESER